MATRKVRTPAGAKFYGLPIGSTITDDAVENNAKDVVTLVRLRSIQRQMMQAQRVGDMEKYRSLRAKLSNAFNNYSEGRGLMQSVYELLDFDEPDALGT